VDGSVSDDLPTKRLARLYGVNHYIVSQANPAVLPFVTGNKHQHGTLAIVKNTARRTTREWLNAAAAIMHKPLSRDTGLAQVANTFLSMVNQDYIGDVNILPSNRFHNPFKILAHLSTEEVMKLVAAGERATWRRMEMIRVQTRISKTLDRLLQEHETEFLRSNSASSRRKKAA
jgi:TAG lipase / steryl ester hydrolase / phospholipase A2 / LPA acyltransferase